MQKLVPRKIPKKKQEEYVNMQDVVSICTYGLNQQPTGKIEGKNVQKMTGLPYLNNLCWPGRVHKICKPNNQINDKPT